VVTVAAVPLGQMVMVEQAILVQQAAVAEAAVLAEVPLETRPRRLSLVLAAIILVALVEGQ
jgi:hypothetical protein